MKKRVFVTLGAAVVTLGLITGCGASDTATSDAGTSQADTKVVKVAASTVPHAEILAEAKAELEAEGYTLEVTEFQDYVQPNKVVEDGDYDANYFQHTPYLDDFNAEKGTHLVAIAKIHYEPFGIYSGSDETLDNIREGAKIAVPNDTTNEARALLLLEANQIITLREGAGLTATIHDIEENPYNVEIVELEAAQVPRVIDEMDFVVLNGNYALEAGFDVSRDAIAVEAADSQAAQTYANIICVREGNEEEPGIQALVKILQGEKIQEFITANYAGAVVPITN
jgi:ABC-type metal ion transport system, periplasmic component/surface antigen